MNKFTLWLQTRTGKIVLLIVILLLIGSALILAMYYGIIPTPGAAGCPCGGFSRPCRPCRM